MNAVPFPGGSVSLAMLVPHLEAPPQKEASKSRNAQQTWLLPCRGLRQAVTQVL